MITTTNNNDNANHHNTTTTTSSSSTTTTTDDNNDDYNDDADNNDNTNDDNNQTHDDNYNNHHNNTRNDYGADKAASRAQEKTVFHEADNYLFQKLISTEILLSPMIISTENNFLQEYCFVLFLQTSPEASRSLRENAVQESCTPVPS